MSEVEFSPSGFPPGLSPEEAKLFMDGLTQTCAALRRRIAELEADNSVLQRVNMAASAHPYNGTVAAAGSSGPGLNGQTLLPKGGVGMALVSPSEVDGCVLGKAGIVGGVTGRVSSTPNRTRYSAGFSRFSLPSNLSPGHGDASANDETVEGPTPGEKARSVWEGLTLAHRLTGDEKELTFLEFAEVGVGVATLSGARPLQPWGQDVEVLSTFPGSDDQSKGPRADSGAGMGDGSLVQGLGEFCFPSGASISLVRSERSVLETVPEDRIHLVQFTDCDNASTYGCCVTVTHLLQDPPARLVQRLQEREVVHSSATRLQRFLRRVCSSRRVNRARRSPAGLPATYGDAPRRPSRFGYQTPPPGVDGGTGSGTTTLEHSPTSFSGMINRLFNASPGMEGDDGSGVVAITGGVPYSVGDAAAARGLAFNKASMLTVVGDDAPASVPPHGTAHGLVAARAAMSPVIPSLDAASSGGNSPAGRFSSLSSPSPLTPRNFSPKPGAMARSALPADSSVTVRGAYRGFRGESSENNFHGMFSDDESESDAGHSTDRESIGSGGSDEGTRRFVGRDGVVWRQARGSPADTKARRDVRMLVDSRVTPSLACGGSGLPLTPEVGGERGKIAAAGGGDKCGWAVMVERCYVMLGCHKNQPLMLKVLKAVADSERSPRLSSAASPSRPRPLSAGKQGAVHDLRMTPPKRAEGGSNSNTPDENQRSASRFRTVAAAAEEEAKTRHRRMLRDKFLHQVRTDKTCIEEGKKVSIHCPAFLRTPLEVNAAPLETWSTAVLFACVPEATILRALAVLLLEKTLVVCGKDVGMVSMTTTALLSLLDPFKWEGVFVPVVPLKLMDVLDSPVPALVGVQAPFEVPVLDPLGYAMEGVVVLDLDARPASIQLFMGGMEEKLPDSEDVIGALEEANTLTGKGRFMGTLGSSRPLVRRLNGSRETSPKEQQNSKSGRIQAATTTAGWGRGTSSPGRRSHFAFQAKTFMSGVTPEERSTVLRLRGIVKGHVSALCGDLGTRGTWRKYGAFNSTSYHFEFQPAWFTEPLETRFKFQAGVARTQMFVSYVDRCRLRDLEALNGDSRGQPRTPVTKGSPQASEAPLTENSTGKHSALGRAPPLPARAGNRASPGGTTGTRAGASP